MESDTIKHESDAEHAGGSSSDYEQDFSEDEYEEKKRPRKRAKRSQAERFLDIAAGEAEEYSSDDETAERGYRQVAAEIRRRDEERRQRPRPDFLDESLSLEQQAQLIDDKYRDLAAERQLEKEETGELLQQSLLPSIRDPKLWFVRCLPGKEHEAVFALMGKYYALKGTPNALFIRSAFVTNAAAGYIYVEADKQVHVTRACQGLRILQSWKTSIVPIKEMVQALEAKQKPIVVNPDSWVRIKRGIYKGDLGKVYNVDSHGQTAMVRLLPRIDYTKIGATHSPDRRGRPNQPKRSKSQRVTARLFNPNQVRELGGIVDRKRDNRTSLYFDVFNNNKFHNGFLYKDMAFSGLETDNVQPKLSELDAFQQRLSTNDADDEEEEDVEDPRTILASIPSAAPPTILSKGTLVKVIAGDLKNLTGVVMSAVGSLVTIMPSHVDLNEPVQFSIGELQKFFKVGDHVKVCNGTFKNHTGLIVQVDEGNDTVHIFSDGSSNLIQVLSRDIIETPELSAAAIENEDVIDNSRKTVTFGDRGGRAGGRGRGHGRGNFRGGFRGRGYRGGRSVRDAFAPRGY